MGAFSHLAHARRTRGPAQHVRSRSREAAPARKPLSPPPFQVTVLVAFFIFQKRILPLTFLKKKGILHQIPDP